MSVGSGEKSYIGGYDMNIRHFKEKVMKLDDYKTNFYIFRIWVENCFDSYKKSMEKNFVYAKRKATCLDEQFFKKSNEYKDLYFEWMYIKIYCNEFCGKNDKCKRKHCKGGKG